MLDLDKELADADRVVAALEQEIDEAREESIECLEMNDKRGTAKGFGKMEAFERAIQIVDSLSYSRES